MMIDKSLALFLSFAWLVGLAVAYFLVLPVIQGRARVFVTASQIAVLALLVRLVPMIILPVGADYDIESFQLVGQSVVQGEEVYSSAQVASRHPYLPLQLYVIGGMTALSATTSIPFVVWVKLPGVLGDVAICLMIYHAVRRARDSTHTASVFAMLYAFNPVAILVSAYHGQFDALPAALTMAAWYVWRFKPPEYLGWSAALLGVAILDKTWPVLFIPVIVLRLRGMRIRLIYLMTALAVPIVGLLIYLWTWQTLPSPLLRRALTHAGVSGWWGLGALLNILESTVQWGGQLLAALVPSSRYISLGVVGISFVFTRRQDALESFVTGLLLFYVFTLGFGLQWLVWVVPFATLLGARRGLSLFTLGAMLHLIVSLFGLHLDALIPRTFAPPIDQLILRVGALPAWGAALVWVIMRLCEARRSAGAQVSAVQAITIARLDRA